METDRLPLNTPPPPFSTLACPTSQELGQEDLPAGSIDFLARELDRLEAAAAALDPGPAARRDAWDAVGALAEGYLAGLDLQPPLVADPVETGTLRGSLGEAGIPLGRALGLFADAVLAPGAHPASPGHLAYIPGGGLYLAALADLLAAVTNKFSGLFATGPGAVRLENQVLRWTADLVGYPATAGGSILSGGSLANLGAVTAARQAHGLRTADVPRAVVYLTAQTHHSIPKALRLAGLGEAVQRVVAGDERGRLDPAALARAIAADRAQGLRPWLVVATAGSTDTGAVDPLDALASVTAAAGCWLHVDAAYGGFFLLTAAGRTALRGIERADSVVLDPHKSLFLPWGSGILLCRDVRHLLAAHRATGSYLQDAEQGAVPDPEELSPADVSPELSRPLRALRMWLPLAVAGVAPFRAALAEKLLLARYFHRQVAALGFAVGPLPELSVVTFRWAPAGLDDDACDRLNQALAARLRADGRIFLSSTTLDGRFTLRLVPLSFRTHRRTIDLALTVLAEQLPLLAAEATR